jgi:hypothetical protein
VVQRLRARDEQGPVVDDAEVADEPVKGACNGIGIQGGVLDAQAVESVDRVGDGETSRWRKASSAASRDARRCARPASVAGRRGYCERGRAGRSAEQRRPAAPGDRQVTGLFADRCLTADQPLAVRDADTGPVTPEYEAWLERRAREPRAPGQGGVRCASGHHELTAGTGTYRLRGAEAPATSAMLAG